jgi:hypothetical protein
MIVTLSNYAKAYTRARKISPASMSSDSIDGAAARLFNFSSIACRPPDLMISRIAFASLAALLMSAIAAAQQEQEQ